MGRFGINRDSYGFEIPDIYNNAASSPSDPFSPEYRTVYDSFIVKPAADIATQQDTMVRALVSLGIWATRDIFYVEANNDDANSRINWINPGTFDLIPSGAVIPVHTAYRGYQGDGANGFLRTQYNPATHGVNYTQNSASMFFYSRTDAAAGYDMGANAAADSIFSARIGGISILRINDATSMNGGVVDSLGFYIGSRLAANLRHTFKNGVSIGNDAQASTGIPNAEIYLLCQNSGGPASLTTRQHCIGGAGGAVSVADALPFFNAVETYLDYVGAGVI